jgi:hypothetical protein
MTTSTAEAKATGRRINISPMAVTKLTDMIEFTFLIFVSFSFSQAAANNGTGTNNPYIKILLKAIWFCIGLSCHWK